MYAVWSVGQLVGGRLVGWWSVGRSVGRSSGRSAGRLVGELDGKLVGKLVGKLGDFGLSYGIHAYDY